MFSVVPKNLALTSIRNFNLSSYPGALGIEIFNTGSAGLYVFHDIPVISLSRVEFGLHVSAPPPNVSSIVEAVPEVGVQ